MRPFLTNKGHLNHQDTMIFDGKKIKTNNTELVEVFNNHDINIVEKSSEKKQEMSQLIIILKTKGLLYT